MGCEQSQDCYDYSSLRENSFLQIDSFDELQILARNPITLEQYPPLQLIFKLDKEEKQLSSFSNELAYVIQKLPNLQNLTICIQVGNADIPSVDKLIQASYGSPDLKRFHISISAQQDFRKYKNLAKLIMKCPQTLSHFSFDSADADDEELQFITQTLGSMVHLRVVCLSLADSKITDKSLEQIKIMAAQLSRLEKLELNCQACEQLTDVGLKNVQLMLGLSSSWQSFDLNVSHCEQITDIGLETIGYGLTHCMNLSELSLNFSMSPTSEKVQITSMGVQNLAQSIQKVTYLKKLRLYFNGLKDLDNEGLKSLAKVINSHRDYLFSVIVYVNFCQNIQDDGVVALMNCVEKCQMLSRLSLSLRKCHLLTDNAVLKIVSVAQALKLLKEFDLYMDGCPELSKGCTDKVRIAFHNTGSFIKF